MATKWNACYYLSVMKVKQHNKKPRVLVVIATLGKRDGYLRLALDSIKAQDTPDVDIVMVYPLESNSTKRLAREYGAASIDDPGNMSAAVNIGILSGWDTHDYVVWVGDDDLLLPGSLRASLSVLEEDSSVAATFGHCQYVNKKGQPIFMSKAGKLAPAIASWGPNLIPMPGSVLRMNALKKLDYLFDPNLRYAMDLDLFLRLKCVGSLRCINMPVAAFRWHPDSTTVSQKQNSLLETEMVKNRYLPWALRPFSRAWNVPLRFLAKLAAARLNEAALRIS